MGGPGYYLELVFCGTLGTLYFEWVSPGSSNGSGCRGKVLNDNNWHTVLVTYDGTTLTLYEDGISQSTTTPSPTINTIGNNNNYVGKAISYDNFIGSLKNVMYYDYVITMSYALANSYQAAGVVIYNTGKYCH